MCKHQSSQCPLAIPIHPIAYICITSSYSEVMAMWIYVIASIVPNILGLFPLYLVYLYLKYSWFKYHIN